MPKRPAQKSGCGPRSPIRRRCGLKSRHRSAPGLDAPGSSTRTHGMASPSPYRFSSGSGQDPSPAEAGAQRYPGRLATTRASVCAPSLQTGSARQPPGHQGLVANARARDAAKFSRRRRRGTPRDAHQGVARIPRPITQASREPARLRRATPPGPPADRWRRVYSALPPSNPMRAMNPFVASSKQNSAD